jgi:DNA-binding transcriptional MerR regulator
MESPGRTIGRLAEEAGVGVETVRFYQRRGLLPLPAAPRQGFRRYGDDVLWRLRYIKQARELGFSLAEIAALQADLPGGPSFCAAFRQAVEAKIAALDAEAERLARQRAALSEVLAQCRVSSAAGRCPIVANSIPRDMTANR